MESQKRKMNSVKGIKIVLIHNNIISPRSTNAYIQIQIRNTYTIHICSYNIQLYIFLQKQTTYKKRYIKGT